MLVEWLRKAPTSVVIAVIVVCGIISVSVLGAFVVLSINGVDTSDLRQWIQTIGITVVLPLLGVNTLTGLVSAKSASRAEDQTNGQLTQLVADVAALKAQGQQKGPTDG